MAVKIAFIILAVIFPVIVSAEDFVVGDDKGWTIGFNYQAWAEGKDFRVGDRLVFNYPKGAHNVFKVNGTGFNSCIIPPANEAFTSGNDVIPLATPGRKWYICGVKKHCAERGQKLFITVNDGASETAPKPSSAHGTLPFAYQIVVAALMVAAVVEVHGGLTTMI